MDSNETCWICAASNVVPTVRYYDWQIRLCQNCGFRFATDGKPIVSDEHYDEDYFVPFVERDTKQKWADVYASRLGRLKELAPTSKLLEAGAGASVFSLNAVDYGFDVNVIDASPWAVDFLTSHDGVTGEVQDLNNSQLPIRSFGAIHCCHVLEHLTNPRGFLEQCLNCLEDNGVMYLSFPAYEPWILGLKDTLYRLGFTNHPYLYQAPDHVSYFDAKCIEKTLTDVGFEILQLKRRKFVSLYDKVNHIGNGGILRRCISSLVALGKPVTRLLGFRRDLEIIVRRPQKVAESLQEAA